MPNFKTSVQYWEPHGVEAEPAMQTLPVVSWQCVSWFENSRQPRHYVRLHQTRWNWKILVLSLFNISYFQAHSVLIHLVTLLMVQLVCTRATDQEATRSVFPAFFFFYYPLVISQEWSLTKSGTIKHSDLCLALENPTGGAELRLKICNNSDMQVKQMNFMQISIHFAFYFRRNGNQLKMEKFSILPTHTCVWTLVMGEILQ